MLNDIKPLITLMLGAMIGTVTGLLIAPDKGSNTRKELVQKGKKSVDNLNNEIRKLQKKLSRITGQRAKIGSASLSKKENSGNGSQKQTVNKGKAGTKTSPEKSEGQTKTSVAARKKSTTGTGRKSSSGSSTKPGNAAKIPSEQSKN